MRCILRTHTIIHEAHFLVHIFCTYCTRYSYYTHTISPCKTNFLLYLLPPPQLRVPYVPTEVLACRHTFTTSPPLCLTSNSVCASRWNSRSSRAAQKLADSWMVRKSWERKRKLHHPPLLSSNAPHPTSKVLAGPGWDEAHSSRIVRMFSRVRVSLVSPLFLLLARGRPLTMLRVTFEILSPPSPLHTNVTHFYTETLGEMLRWGLTPPSPLEKCYA